MTEASQHPRGQSSWAAGAVEGPVLTSVTLGLDKIHGAQLWVKGFFLL